MITIILTLTNILLVILLIVTNYNKYHGELQIDSSDPDTDIYRFVVYDEAESLSTKRSVRFKVLPDVDMSRE